METVSGNVNGTSSSLDESLDSITYTVEVTTESDALRAAMVGSTGCRGRDDRDDVGSMTRSTGCRSRDNVGPLTGVDDHQSDANKFVIDVGEFENLNGATAACRPFCPVDDTGSDSFASGSVALLGSNAGDDWMLWRCPPELGEYSGGGGVGDRDLPLRCGGGGERGLRPKELLTTIPPCTGPTFMR